MDLISLLHPKLGQISMEKNEETLNNHENHHEEQNEELEKLKINVTEARNSSTDLRVHHKSNVRNSQTQKSHSMLREKQGK